MKVLWFYDMAPNKLAGLELFAARLAELYPAHQFTVAFNAPPTPAVQAHFAGKAEIALVRQQAAFNGTAAREVDAILRRTKPDLVVYCLAGILRPLPWLARLRGARVVYTDHTSRTRDFRATGVKGAIQRLIARPVSLVIAASEFTRNVAVKENLFRCPSIAVLNGIDTNRAETSGPEFRDRFDIPRDATVVTQCSWLVPEKGVDLFVQAAARLARPGVHFVVTGEGNHRAEYEQMAQGLPITFTGKIGDPMREGVYAASDIFCLPSRWKESCGLVNLEAMAFGVPVVATRIGGIPEYVPDKECGLLVEPNVNDLVSKLETLITDGELRQRLGTNAARRAHELYTIDRMAHQYAAALGLAGPQG